MRVAVMTAPGEVQVEDRADPTILKPTDAIIRLSATCICGSDLWPYRGIEALDGPRPMGHEYAGIVEEVGSAVSTVKPGQFVVGSFFASDNTCEICRSGYQPSCPYREAFGPTGAAQAERMRVPLADGTLVATPEVSQRGTGAALPGHLRRARHRLVRRCRGRGRAGQDRRRGR
jgi:threonine dehydrogenase-like Zn-dependent dehydrogenase